MVAIPLTSGAYQAQGYLANAQRAVNVYPEKNPDETKSPMPVTHYPRPGLVTLSAPGVPGRGRCLYTSTTGDLYAVVDQTVYYINSDWVWTSLGNLLTPSNLPVSIADNGANAIVVDGDKSANNIDLVLRTMTVIGDPNFLGSTRADFLDSFLILNNPGTNQWYCTLSNQIVFNGLFIGRKTAWPDNVQCVIAIERVSLVLGKFKSEVWYNAGTVPFPFQILPGNIVEQGCAAPYSAAKMDVNCYWLSQSPEGDRMVMRMNSQNVATRISTNAIEFEFRKYPRIDDAIGSVYQITGHSFYCLHFPTADITWVFDEATGQWHQDAWIDNNGILRRSRVAFNAFAYGTNVGLDWSNGNLYQLDPNTYTDAGQPIACIRSFPHVMNEMKQVSHARFVADFQTGTQPNTGEITQFLSPFSSGFSSGFGPLTTALAPVLNLRCSRDGGNSWGNNRPKQLISAGHYRSLMRWPSLGLARDMVFELSWSAPMASALNGAYIDVMQASA